MAYSGNNDPKLNEVKAVLQRLQGLNTPGDPAGQRPANKGAPRARGAALVAGLIIFAMAAGIFGAAYVFVGFKGSEPKGAGGGIKTVQPAAVKAALEAARNLMAKGQVRAAREQLLVLAWRGSPDAAWDLARSYDPNVLVAIPGADAPPDVKEAVRWYRTWHAAAVKEGLIADSVSLERIIGSMGQKPIQ